MIICFEKVASECSFTDSHYEALVGIQQKLNKGNRNIFQVLAFPSNQFGNQEPNVNIGFCGDQFCSFFIQDDAHIQAWAKDMFDVNFPIFAKGAVVREGDQSELPEVWKLLSGN